MLPSYFRRISVYSDIKEYDTNVNCTSNRKALQLIPTLNYILSAIKFGLISIITLTAIRLAQKVDFRNM